MAIDDNPAELAALREQLPELTLFQTPRDGEGWRRLLNELQTLCGTWQVTEEDRLRTRTLQQAQAHEQPLASSTESSWRHLRELQLRFTMNPEAFSDPRLLELINKTNQFNLTGERISQEAWLQWASIPGAFCVSVRLADRFGEFGTIGVMTGRWLDKTVEIRQCVVSCRAFGRGVETLLLGHLLQHETWQWLRGLWVETGKNEPARRFLRDLGCEVSAGEPWRVSRSALERAVRQVLDETQAVVTVRERGAQPVMAGAP